MNLSRALNCSVNTIRWHEAGARMMRADMIVRAAAVMGVTPDELLIQQVAEQQEQ
jgi:transcriptional regulator with XRE-family HTH domain